MCGPFNIPLRKRSPIEPATFVLRGHRVDRLDEVRRSASPGEWRTNVSLGGRAEACRLDPSEEEVAIRAARAVGAVVAGVDVVQDLDRNHPVVLEVNAVPGWRAISRVTGIDIAAAILECLVDRGRNR